MDSASTFNEQFCYEQYISVDSVGKNNAGTFSEMVLGWTILPRSFGCTNLIAQRSFVSPSLTSHAHY